MNGEFDVRTVALVALAVGFGSVCVAAEAVLDAIEDAGQAWRTARAQLEEMTGMWR